MYTPLESVNLSLRMGRYSCTCLCGKRFLVEWGGIFLRGYHLDSCTAGKVREGCKVFWDSWESTARQGFSTYNAVQNIVNHFIHIHFIQHSNFKLSNPTPVLSDNTLTTENTSDPLFMDTCGSLGTRLHCQMIWYTILDLFLECGNHKGVLLCTTSLSSQMS